MARCLWRHDASLSLSRSDGGRCGDGSAGACVDGAAVGARGEGGSALLLEARRLGGSSRAPTLASPLSDARRRTKWSEAHGVSSSLEDANVTWDVERLRDEDGRGGCHDANGSGCGGDAGRRGAGAGVDGATARSCSAVLKETRRLRGYRASRVSTLASAPLMDARRRIEWSETRGLSSWEGGARGEALEDSFEDAFTFDVEVLRDEDWGGCAATGALLADDSSPGWRGDLDAGVGWLGSAFWVRLVFWRIILNVA